MKNPDRGDLRQKMQYSEDKKGERQITVEGGEKRRDEKKRKKKEKIKTIIKNGPNVVKSEKP